IKQSIESINGMVTQLNSAHRTLNRGSERALGAATQIEDVGRRQDQALRELVSQLERIRKVTL
ncbi:MAG TPA: hypothetical protein VIM73_03705, partial [Polyangiaceae bacterium]